MCRNKKRGVVAAVVGVGLVVFLIYSELGNSVVNYSLKPETHTMSTTTDTTQVTISTRDQTTAEDSTSRDELYGMRLRQMKRACEQMDRAVPPASFDLVPADNLVDVEHGIIYCHITKVGSTFWKRVLTVMESRGNLSSPFQIRLWDVHLSSFGEIRKKLSANRLSSFLKSSLSFIFVREPYGRLFSAYVDKLYNPNDFFWQKIGKKVVRSVRANASALSKNCGHDVTFPELVKAITNFNRAKTSIEHHLTPMHQQCDPCRYRYDFIGKMETFKEDAEFLLEKWRKQYGDIHVQFDNFEEERDVDTARGHVRFMYEARQCVNGSAYPAYNMLLRTWRHLQIRGVLSKTRTMPVSPSEADAIDQEEFTDIVVEAVKLPVDRTELKQQRDEALIQAYQSVPLEDMEQLRRYVLKDCQYFGYDDRPEKLFKRSGRKSAGRFNYFPGLTENVDPYQL